MKLFWVGKKGIKTLEMDSDPTILEGDDAWQIALDIIDNNEHIIIFAPIAGIELDEIDLILNKSVLTIKWEREKPAEYYEEWNVLRNTECYFWKFIRNIILPENLDFDLVKAVMENNLLKITIPKLHVSSQSIKINRVWDEF
jgi:HSP20 family protein